MLGGVQDILLFRIPLRTCLHYVGLLAWLLCSSRMGTKYSLWQGKVPRLGMMLSCVVWCRTRLFFHWLVNYRSNKYLAMTVRHVPGMSKRAEIWMWNRSDLCKNGEVNSQFSCEWWERHSYSFLRQPLALMMSVQEDMGVPLKRAFLDIKCEENSACDCPTKLEDWWQSSAARNFASHCWQE